MPTKIKKSDKIFQALKATTIYDGFEIIPFIDKYMEVKPNTGVYKTEDLYKKPDSFYHPSGDCKKCLRQLYFEKVYNDKQEHSITTKRTFKVGHAIHSMVQAWIEDMSTLQGFPKTAYGAEVKVRNKELNVSGSVDDIVRFPCDPELDVPLEIKTINSQQFGMLVSPKPEHIDQVNMYLTLKDLEFGIILYIEKDYPHGMKEFIINRTDMSNVFDRWDQVTEAIVMGDPSGLPREFKETSIQCKRCPASFRCRENELMLSASSFNFS